MQVGAGGGGERGWGEGGLGGGGRGGGDLTGEGLHEAMEVMLTDREQMLVPPFGLQKPADVPQHWLWPMPLPPEQLEE